jgi:hypothetical protein
MKASDLDEFISKKLEEIIFAVDRNDGNFTEYELGAFDAYSIVRDELRNR